MSHTAPKWTLGYFCDMIHGRKVRHAVGVGRAYTA